MSVKVYDGSGSHLLYDSGAVASVTTVFNWIIDVYLYQHRTTHPNRDNNGYLIQLWGADGSRKLLDYTVLGRSVSGDSPLIYLGNTPTGVYSGYLYGPMSNTSSYGPYKVIATTGISGQIIDSDRDGIWIHGGSPETNSSKLWYPLRPTYGCVRIMNSTQYTLQQEVQAAINSGSSSTGTVNIREWNY